MTTPTSTGQPSTDSRFEAQLEAHLAGHLPGLSDTELTELAANVRAELEERIGRVLSEGLTEAQMSEFEALMDSDDDGDACGAWLAAVVPNYRATVAAQSAGMIAEVVAKVAEADADTLQGSRRVGQISPFSMDLVERHLDTHELKYSQPGDGIRLAFAATESAPDVVIGIKRAGTKGELLTFTGSAPDQTYPVESPRALHDHASDWNAKTWMPKAVVSTDEETDTSRLVAEIAIPTGGLVTQAHVDATVIRCFASIFGFFAGVREQFVEQTHERETLAP